MPSRSICARANTSISRSFESGAPRASSVSRSTSDAAPPTPSQTSSMSRLTMRGETSSSFAKARKSSRPTSSILLVDPMRMAIRRSRPPYTTVEAMSYTGANANDDQSVPRSTVRFLRCPSQFPRTAFARYLAPHLHAHGLPPFLKRNIESDHVRNANRLVQLGRRLSVLQLRDKHYSYVAHLGKFSLRVSKLLATIANRRPKVPRASNGHVLTCLQSLSRSR